MRIAIAAPTYDIDGHVEIDTLPDNTDGITQRRINRVATLDGDVSIVDGGYVEGDRTFEYTWSTISKAHNDAVDYMVRTYSMVWLACERGFFVAAPESFIPGGDISTIRLLAKSKLSA